MVMQSDRIAVAKKNARRRQTNPLPLQAVLRTRFDYDTENGVLIWRRVGDNAANGWNARWAGTPAGSGAVYKIVRISGVDYQLHRVVWGWHHGTIPAGLEVDHIDGNPTNNRIENLRLATIQEQQRNGGGGKRADSPTTFRGVGFRKDTRRWRAYIDTGGKHLSLGCFDTDVEAAHAYDKAAREHFGAFARLNFPDD